MACKQRCQPLNTAANWVTAGVKQKWVLSAILQVWERPSDRLPELPWWEKEIYFFPNHWHRLAHPPVAVVPKAINHLKWIWWKVFPYKGGKLIKTRQMEKERAEKIVFHSVTEVSEPDSCPHPETLRELLSTCTRIYHSRGEAVNQFKHTATPCSQWIIIVFLFYCDFLCFISISYLEALSKQQHK